MGPDKKDEPVVKHGAGVWTDPSKTQPTHLPVVGSVVDPSLGTWRHVAICDQKLVTVTTVISVMTVMTIIKKCHDC